jgi:hypothetical protein
MKVCLSFGFSLNLYKFYIIHQRDFVKTKMKVTLGGLRMFENFEVNKLFEGQAHERHQFSLHIQGDEYKGLIRDGKIHWYNPHPKQKIAEKDLHAVESQVFNRMNNIQ